MASYLGINTIKTEQPATSNFFVRGLFLHKFAPYLLSAKLQQSNHLKPHDFLYQLPTEQLPSFTQSTCSPISNPLSTSSSSLQYQLNSRVYLPMKQFIEFGLSVGVPLISTITPLDPISFSPVNNSTLAFLTTAFPHLSNTPQFTPKITPQSSSSSLSPPTTPSISLDYTHFKINGHSLLSTINESNIASLQNGFLIPPDSCSCTEMFSLANKKDPISTAPTKWTKCLHCYIMSSSVPDFTHLYQRLIYPTLFPSPPLTSSSQPTPPPQHCSQLLISPLPQYSHAVRVKLEIHINTQLDSTTQSLLRTTLNLLTQDKHSLRDLILHSPLISNSISSIPYIHTTFNPVNNTQISELIPILFLKIIETYPNGIVVPTSSTIIQIETPSITQSISSTSLSPASLLYTPHLTTAQLFPLSSSISSQTLSVQTIFRLLWVNINKYFYTAIPSQFQSISNQQSIHLDSGSQVQSISTTASNTAQKAYHNIQMANIKGILLHGPPGVGKTFAAVKALELFPSALTSSLTSTSTSASAALASSSSPSLLDLPIIPSSTTHQSIHTIQYPMIRFCSIDSSSVGEYMSGQSESRIDNVFFHCQQRTISATLPPLLLSTHRQLQTSSHPQLLEAQLEQLWCKGFPIEQLTNTSPYTSNDRLYPLFSLSHLNTIISSHEKTQSASQQSSPFTQSVQIQSFIVLTVLLIDEIDSICTTRDYSGESSQGGPVNTSLTNHFLTLLDGLHGKSSSSSSSSPQPPQFAVSTATNSIPLSPSSSQPSTQLYPQLALNTTSASSSPSSLTPTPLFVIGTTNNPNNVDIAIKRSGRLDQLLTVQPPSGPQRFQLLQQLCKNSQLSSDIDLNMIAESCIGYVAADLANLVRAAKTHRLKQYLTTSSTTTSLEQESTSIQLTDFLFALQNTGASSLRTNAVHMLKSSISKKAFESHAAINHSISSTALFTTSQRELLQRELIGDFASTIGGLFEAKLRLLEAVVWPIKYRKECSLLNLSPPHGILLYGPPGNGKTSLARAVSLSLNATFFPLDMATVYNSYLGESEKLLREIFAKARDNAPAVIFIDELDSIVSKRNMGDGGSNSSNDVQGRILSTLLNEMDGIPTTNTTLTIGAPKPKPKPTKSHSQPSSQPSSTLDHSANNIVLVFGATNRIDMLDAALLRPGRFDYIINIPNCTEQTSYEILTTFCLGKVDPSINLYELNKHLYQVLNDSGLGANGSNITNAVYQTANIAVKRYIHKQQQQQHSLSSSSMLADDNNTSASQSIWSVQNDGNSLGTVHRHEIHEYFDDADTTKRPMITIEDFAKYLRPLEDMIILKANKL